MMRNIIMKTYYRKVIDGIVNNFTVCSNLRKTYPQQNAPTDKIIRLNENALVPQILVYFRECVNYEYHFNNISGVNVIDKWDKLNTLNNKELSEMILSLSEPTFKRKLFKIYLKKIDKECCSRLPHLTNYEIFNLLHDFVCAVPHMIVQLTFYTKSIHRFSFLIDHCSKIELLQLCFYVALQKKTDESKSILRDCLNKLNTNYLNSFNLTDLVILCNSSYKTSTKITHRKILDKIIEAIYNNLNILQDTTKFVTLIKCLRQNKAQNEELLATISNTIFFNKTIENYNFTASTHILAFYADALYYDDNLFNSITEQCIKYLQETDSVTIKNEYFTKQIRIKDIARFLWSLSYVSYENLDEHVISKNIVPLLKSYIHLGELEKNIEYFIDILLSMWILDYQPNSQLFNSIITKNTITQIYGKHKKRYASRLNLLLICVQLENKELIPSSLIVSTKAVPWNQKGQMRNRPYLKTLYVSLCQISSKININKFEFTSPIPHLNIIGITGYDKENTAKLYIELIDDLMQVKNSDFSPHGLMKLKLRLLQKSKKNILIIFKEDIEYLTQSEINKFLERKIKVFNY